jgi:hypothetical protein
MAGTDEEEEEDDYLSMTFTDPPAPTKKESSLQRTARLKREAAARGKVPSKLEREAQSKLASEKALSTPLPPTNKGALLMSKMGFIPGSALGQVPDARTRPIEVQMKEGREGIGMEGEKKRKIREAAEEAEGKEKRVKVTVEEFTERRRGEVEERRVEGQVWGAMRVLEKIEMDHQGGEEEKGKELPLKSVNVLYRPLVKQRLEKERERRMRYDLDQSLSRNWQYEEEEQDEKLAFGEVVEEDLEEEDGELEEFEGLSAREKLERLVGFLREKYWYCFWCKWRYEDEAMEGCPGLSEDEHG